MMTTVPPDGSSGSTVCASGKPEQRGQAERLLDVILDGLSTDRH